MKNYILSFFSSYRFSLLIVIITLLNCSGGDSGDSSTSPSDNPQITVSNDLISFGQVYINTESDLQSMNVVGSNLSQPVNLSVTGAFKISSDNINFSNNVQVSSASSEIFIKFSPTQTGLSVGEILLESPGAESVEVTLTGTGITVVHSYTAFNQQPLGFGGGFNQSASQVFSLHGDMSNIEKVKMFLQIDCPSSGCDDWDRFANVKVKDPASGSWFEIGRYITPYWVGTQQLDRGLEFDITDFKSYLTGEVELRIYIENWTAKADIVTVEFDFVEGTPDYPYYAVSEVLGYHINSIDGVPYGVDHNFDLDKNIQIPNNTESAHLRTIISGWGHATPNDIGGRPCAEWCFRTHNVKINGSSIFQHYMGPIGCASNPINNQNPGNWQPDRAGWCPGMVVPVRSNDLDLSSTGSSFNFEYDFEDWVSDGAGGNAYYATSTYIVVKSSSQISIPIVTD
jgi:hypothetical protein